MNYGVKMSYVTTGSITLLILLMFIPNQMLFSQSSEELSSSPALKETIKIVSPITTQNVSTGKELIIAGQSSDNTLKNCSVSLIINDVRPYQYAFASGAGGTTDFSQWKFVLHTNYTHIIEGENKITAKLLCTSAPTRWYSVFVNGVPNYSNEDMLSPVPSQVRQDIPSTNLSDIKDTASNNGVMLVSISSLKNPVARGDTQNTTITVTDSVSRAIANADVDGKLIYPGDNYKKDFKGKTDSQGKFVYSWTIGKNGDVGPLSVQVDVTSQAYIPSSVTSSFDIVDSIVASGIDNVLADTLDNKSEIDFVIAGDYGCDSKTRQTIKSMEKLNPNLVFALGDLSEVKNTNCFFDIISKLHDDDKVKIALGEDDTDSNKRYGDFLEHFDLESPFYSFDYENVHFLAMSTGKNSLIPYANGSAQYKFINDDLSKAANNSDIDWIIVYGYRPFYTSPTIHPSTEILRQTYPPLFEKYGVDLVISSHNHNYQRSYPLVYNIEETRQPIIKDVNASRYYMPGVPIYVVVGTAGNNLYDFRGQAPFMVTQVQESGFLHVNISNTNQHMLTGTFYNIGTGNYDDKFMIIKSEFE
jgi:Calcineurin-like phosphoesterase